MPFDQTTRNRLARFVGEARALLTEEFTRQLQLIYGMDPASGEVGDPDRLMRLSDAERETARLLNETAGHYLPGFAGKPARERRETIDRIVREQAFTVLNRLCALRMAEARGLLIESIGQGYQSRGFQLYTRLAGPALGETGAAYRSYLLSVFDELAVDLAVLFDRFSPQGRLFPREAALLDLLARINDPELEPLWAEDETIGWIYQYFNSKEERKAMRDASAAPRNSRELAVRNQFFTPRYVVEFLTDNTLGRTWYEMTKGQTSLKESCRYLVRRPNEVFLAPGEQAPELGRTGDGETGSDAAAELSQEELLKQPVYIPHRPLKDPRAISMLDPACGSMHFGLYAFDLFERIYEEAWDLEESASPPSALVGEGGRGGEGSRVPLHEAYPSKEAFLRDVPRLIVEHNIHGIDIDPRAVQIAGLSLWLRAQKSWRDQGLKPQDRPQIQRSNVVCAEPMPGDTGLLAEFTARQLASTPEDRAIGEMLPPIFRAMELAGEAGSLLKIEEAIAGVVEAARANYEKALLTRQKEADYLPGFAPERETTLFDLLELPNPEEFWQQAEERIYAALRDYAGQSEDGAGYRRRLFADDAAHGFAFIDLCRKRYDVVLMNPPFGAASKELQSLLENKEYHNRDLASDFVTNALRLAVVNGMIGAITTRTIFFLKGFLEWRDALVSEFGGPRCFLDIGFGVLDAAVEASAFTCQSIKENPTGNYFYALGLHEELEARGADALSRCRQYLVKAESFTNLPRRPFAYWISDQLLHAFIHLPRIGDRFDVLSGGNPRDDFRFVRHWIETSISPTSDFVPYSKGGEFALYYYDVHLMLKWKDDARELKAQAADYRGNLGWSADWRALMMNYDRYFTAGITWPRRTSRLSFRFLPKGCVFGDKSPVILTRDRDMQSLVALIAYLNTSSFNETVSLMVGSSELAQSFEVGIVKACPLPRGDLAKQALNALEIYRNLYLTDAANEDSHAHIGFWSPSMIKESLRTTFDVLNCHRHDIQSMILRLHLELEDLSSSSLGVKPNSAQLTASDFSELRVGLWVSDSLSYMLGAALGRWDIRYATGERQPPELPDPFAPLPVCPPGMLQNAQGLPATSDADIVGVATPHPPAPSPLCGGRGADATDTPTPPSPLVGEGAGGEGHGLAGGEGRYPLRISWPGILVDDEGHPEDIEGRVREAIAVIWGERAEAIEQEVCEILGVRSLRDYFRKPALFFADHLQRYSKSRRQAPIYWSLGTPSSSYTLWIYYHRLTDQTLYSCVNDLVEPKLAQVRDTLGRLRQKSDRSRADEKELERLSDLEQELQDFRAELLRVAAFWKPNLNDGVQITAAPLWKLFQHKPWQKRLKETWEKLEAGEYDWAHLAYSIWPERVREKCKSDKSLAIAHDLEMLYVEPPASAGKKKGRGKKAVVEEDEGMFGEE